MEDLHPLQNASQDALHTMKTPPSALRRVTSFFVLGFLCLALSLALYLFAAYALLDFFEYPLQSSFIESPFLQILLASALACLLPPLFLIDTVFSFKERIIRIFEIHAFLFLILMAVISIFCYYTLSQEDAMASMLNIYYFGGISRLLLCVYLYISIRLCLASQNMLPLKKLVPLKERLTPPPTLDRALFLAQVSGIILMLLAIFHFSILQEVHFTSSYSFFALFFLFFYILFQLYARPYKLWRIPFICVSSIIFLQFVFFEAFLWQAIFACFYLIQCILYYCMYKKSRNWFL